MSLLKTVESPNKSAHFHPHKIAKFLIQTFRSNHFIATLIASKDCPGNDPTMANASNSTFPFLRDFEMDDFATVSFKSTMNTNLGPQTAKASLPVIPVDATHHQLFHCPHNFKRAAVIMKWTEGPKPFEAFDFIPQDPGDVDCWDGLISAEDKRSVDNFCEHLHEFIECKFDDDAKVCRNHERFLTNLKKPESLKVQRVCHSTPAS